jgi:hypothetical protein
LEGILAAKSTAKKKTRPTELQTYKKKQTKEVVQRKTLSVEQDDTTCITSAPNATMNPQPIRGPNAELVGMVPRFL